MSLRPVRLHQMHAGHSGLWTNHNHVDLKTGRIDPSVKLWDVEDLKTHPVLITRDKDGYFHIWCESPSTPAPRFQGRGMAATFHNLDHVGSGFDAEVTA